MEFYGDMVDVINCTVPNHNYSHLIEKKVKVLYLYDDQWVIVEYDGEPHVINVVDMNEDDFSERFIQDLENSRG